MPLRSLGTLINNEELRSHEREAHRHDRARPARPLDGQPRRHVRLVVRAVRLVVRAQRNRARAAARVATATAADPLSCRISISAHTARRQKVLLVDLWSLLRTTPCIPHLFPYATSSWRITLWKNLTPSARIVTIFHLTAQLQNEPPRRAGAASAPRRASYTCDRPPTTRRLSCLRSRRSLPVAFLVVRAWPRSARLSGSLSSLSFFLCDRASAGAVSPVSSSGPGVHDVEHRWLGLPRRPPVP